MSANRPSTQGFDTVPERHIAATLAIFLAVAVASAAIAEGFRRSALHVIELVGDSAEPTRAAGHLRAPIAGALAASATLIAAALGRYSARRWPRQSGLDAIAATARGEQRPISLPATLMRTSATWLCTIGLVPIGRESAIIETGGAIGSSVARRFGGQGATMATAGIAAGFTAAYHAPIAAVLYLDEHLAIRGSRRATTFAIGGASIGFLAATRLFESKPLLPAPHGSIGQLFVAAAIALVPATIAARALLALRNRADRQAAHAVPAVSWWIRAAVGSAAAGLAVAAFPLTAGNGLDALRRAALLTTVSVAFAIALVLAKAGGFVAALTARAPGGALTPTMTVAAGGALLVVTALSGLGADGIHLWAVAYFAATCGVAVGLRAPLTATILLPEMTGRLALFPATALTVAGAVAMHRLIDGAVRRLGAKVPSIPIIHDEDG